MLHKGILKNNKWWDESYGFFGDFYIEGDNSKEGFLVDRRMGLDKRTKVEVQGILKLLNLRPKSKILDIPCGYGRHSIELYKKGFDVVGSDLNLKHLEVAKKNAEKENMVIDFRKENMIDIKYDNEFDGVINMFYSFGFFETDKENLQVLKNFYNALKNEGKFLMHTDVNVPRILSGKYKQDEIRNLSSGSKLRIIDVYDLKTRRIDGKWIIEKNDGEKIEKSYSVRVYEKDEFINMCLSVGFKGCKVYGNWLGDNYNEDAEEIIFVAEK